MDQVIKNYTIHKKIGQGATGGVFYVTDDKNNKYALKLQHNVSESEKEMNNQIMKIKFQNVANTYEQFEFNKDIFNYFCVVMDFCDVGDLFQYLTQYRSILNNEMKRFIIFQIAFGIWEIHQLNIIHRDIKPSNILIQTLDSIIQLKICDLGLSKLQENQILNTLNIGTPYYMAPELIDPNQKKAIYDKSVDIWAFGALIFDFFSSYQLFYGLQIYQIFAQIKQGQNIYQKLMVTINDPLLLDIANSCLSYDPSKRPQIEQILIKLNKVLFYQKQQIFYEQNKILVNGQNQDQVLTQIQDQSQQQHQQNQKKDQEQIQTINQDQSQNKIQQIQDLPQKINLDQQQSENQHLLQNQQKENYQKQNQDQPQNIIQNQNQGKIQSSSIKSKSHVKNKVRLRSLLTDQTLIEQLCLMIEEGHSKDHIVKCMDESLINKLQVQLNQF